MANVSSSQYFNSDFRSSVLSSVDISVNCNFEYAVSAAPPSAMESISDNVSSIFSLSQFSKSFGN